MTEKLKSSVVYCEKHPNQRFWQALRNWSGNAFIFAYYIPEKGKFKGKMQEEDTFYWED